MSAVVCLLVAMSLREGGGAGPELRDGHPGSGVRGTRRGARKTFSAPPSSSPGSLARRRERVLMSVRQAIVRSSRSCPFSNERAQIVPLAR